MTPKERDEVATLVVACRDTVRRIACARSRAEIENAVDKDGEAFNRFLEWLDAHMGIGQT